ncbi:MAG: hypothetical protein JJU03_03040 [Idiomarina sp.]|nr:hypothetical protein [Idiomarina sp.]
MKTTIEGRLRFSLYDCLIVAVAVVYFISVGMTEISVWLNMVLVLVVLGFAVSLFKNRTRGVIIKYDNDTVESFTRTSRNKQRNARVAWRKVYGIDRLTDKGQVALVGKDGKVLLSVPSHWQGVDEFTSVVQDKLEGDQDRAEQVDFYLTNLGHGYFTAGIMGVLTTFLINIVVTIFNTPSGESAWQLTKSYIVIFFVVLGVYLLIQGCRLRSFHIGQNELTLRYLLFTRRLRYDDIASVELVEDPNKPVVDEARRLRINLKGRSRHYMVSEFPDHIETLFASVDQRVKASRSAAGKACPAR